MLYHNKHVKRIEILRKMLLSSGNVWFERSIYLAWHTRTWERNSSLTAERYCLAMNKTNYVDEMWNAKCEMSAAFLWKASNEDGRSVSFHSSVCDLERWGKNWFMNVLRMYFQRTLCRSHSMGTKLLSFSVHHKFNLIVIISRWCVCLWLILEQNFYELKYNVRPTHSSWPTSTWAEQKLTGTSVYLSQPANVGLTSCWLEADDDAGSLCSLRIG